MIIKLLPNVISIPKILKKSSINDTTLLFKPELSGFKDKFNSGRTMSIPKFSIRVDSTVKSSTI